MARGPAGGCAAAALWEARGGGEGTLKRVGGLLVVVLLLL